MSMQQSCPLTANWSDSVLCFCCAFCRLALRCLRSIRICSHGSRWPGVTQNPQHSTNLGDMMFTSHAPYGCEGIWAACREILEHIQGKGHTAATRCWHVAAYGCLWNTHMTSLHHCSLIVHQWSAFHCNRCIIPQPLLCQESRQRNIRA